MKELKEFPVGVGEKLQFYVYRLIDPRNGETFYIGKGKGDRLFQHVNATQSDDVNQDVVAEAEEGVPEDGASLKVQKLNDIRRAGLDVIHIIHRHGIEDEKTAYEVEAALIDAYAGLSNISSGHHSNDRGPMHAQEIIDKYALPEVVLGEEKLLLINVNSANHNSDDELLDRVRFAWRISPLHAKKARYVLAIIHGVVRGVFVPEEWLPATADNFPPLHFGEAISERWGFVGHKASDEIWDHYVGSRGKRLPENIRNKGQNPISYYNC
jgi:hypothetical protein